MDSNKNTYALLALPYSYLVGTIYLGTYWSTFNINPFEHASLVEAIMAAIIPVISTTAFYLASILLVTMILLNDTLYKVSFIVISSVITGVLILIVHLFYEVSEHISWALMNLFILPLPFILMKTDIAKFISNERTRFALLAVISALPVIAMTEAKIRAYQLESGKHYLEASFNDEKQRYMGALGDKYFFLSNDTRNIKILQQDDVKNLSLTLKHNNE